MSQYNLARRLARPIRDFLAGLAVFCAIAVSGMDGTAPAGTGWISSAAHARILELDAAVDPSLAPFLAQSTGLDFPAGGIHQLLALASLAAAFATLVAFNLWFARHLRQVHASYRRQRRE